MLYNEFIITVETVCIVKYCFVFAPICLEEIKVTNTNTKLNHLNISVVATFEIIGLGFLCFSESLVLMILCSRSSSCTPMYLFLCIDHNGDYGCVV